MISFIYARDENYGIGKGNALPWEKNQTDMDWFRMNTIGKTVIMGSKTFESIGSKPLYERTNIVLSRTQSKYRFKGVKVMAMEPYTLATLFKPSEEVFVIGGLDVFKSFLPFVEKLYESVIPGIYESDTFIPKDFSKKFHRDLFFFEKDKVKFTVRSI